MMIMMWFFILSFIIRKTRADVKKCCIPVVRSGKLNRSNKPHPTERIKKFFGMFLGKFFAKFFAESFSLREPSR